MIVDPSDTPVNSTSRSESLKSKGANTPDSSSPNNRENASRVDFEMFHTFLTLVIKAPVGIVGRILIVFVTFPWRNASGI